VGQYAHVVTHVNGRWIGNMRDLAAAIEEAQRDYHHIQLQPDGKEIIISKAVLGARQQGILDKYKIPADRSPGLSSHSGVPSVKDATTLSHRRKIRVTDRQQRPEARPHHARTYSRGGLPE
jgi:hypothetical protein